MVEWQTMISKDFKLSALLGLFVGLLIGMNLLGGKIIPFFGLSASVAIFIVPFTFLITDIVAEVHGAKIARQFLIAGVLAIIMILIFASIFKFSLCLSAKYLTVEVSTAY